MNNKRYAIVRVDNMCPSDFEKIDNLNVCAEPLRYYMNKSVNCNNCRYGDTKEQLIRKIMTAFKIAIKKNKEGKFIKEKSNNRQVAEIIVEFLGVEE